MNGVTSRIRRHRLALFGVKFGPRWVLTVRSLCGMQTTGNRVTHARVSLRGPAGRIADEPDAGLVRNSGTGSQLPLPGALACPRSSRSMSEHRRKTPQPQGGGRAAARRAAQQSSGRRAAPSHGVTSESPSDAPGGDTPYGGRAAARRAAQRGGGRGGGGGGRRRGGGGDAGHEGPGRGVAVRASALSRNASSTTRAPGSTARGAGCRRGNWSPASASAFSAC